MIAKHVDLIAVGILVLVAVLFSGVKDVVVLGLHGSIHHIRTDQGREVHMPPMPEMPAMPKVPQMPRIQIQRD